MKLKKYKPIDCVKKRRNNYCRCVIVLEVDGLYEILKREEAGEEEVQPAWEETIYCHRAEITSRHTIQRPT